MSKRSQETTTLKREPEVKAEDLEARTKWYLKDDDMDQDRKWDYIQHHGVIFPQLFKPCNFPVHYNGEAIKLNALQEELAYYWSQSLGTDWEKNPHYVQNFWYQFLLQFGDAKKKYDSSKFSFVEMRQKILAQKEALRNDEALKARRKKQKQENDRYFGYAIVDGEREKVSGYIIENSTLFKGRGIHPKAGMLKTRVQPQQITINIAENAPVPKCPLPGHAWGEIVHKHDTTWLCGFKDNIKKAHKYIFLAANSKFKGLNDRKKYQKARRLKQIVDQIRKDYRKKLVSKNQTERQIGTATYLIDFLALRVGNQKGQEEADTQGTCSLRVQHVKIQSDNNITLDFLGKDSMRYLNTVQVLPQIWTNMKDFMTDKKEDQNIFHLIDTQMLNDYLKNLMPGLTAKVFRTYNASITLQKELSKGKLAGLTMEQKVEFYNQANKQVAILCNHQKTVRKDFDLILQKTSKEIDLMKEYVKQLTLHKKHLGNGEVKFKDTVVKINQKKELIKKFPGEGKAVESLLKKFKEKVEKQTDKLKKRDENRNISLGTSKTNYNDPRITVSWCKKNEVKIQKVFPKTLQSKFIWAMYSDLDFTF